MKKIMIFDFIIRILQWARIFFSAFDLILQHRSAGCSNNVHKFKTIML